MHFSIVHEQRPDGRWSAQVAELLALLALAEKRFLQIRGQGRN